MQNVRGYKYYGEKSLQNYTQYDLNLKLMMNIKKKHRKEINQKC